MTWQSKTLGEICDAGGGIIKTGPFGSQLHESDYVDEGLPVVMPKDIHEGRVLTDSIAQIDEETATRLNQHALKPGDIVYGRRGDIGRQAFITERERGWLCGTGCLRVTLGRVTELDHHYLHYYLRDPEVIAWIGNQAVGATMPNLNTSILRSVPIRFPDLHAQRKIATVLSAYDDLIENNTRRGRVLEEMARALYREWFVEHRFPGHEGAEFVEDEQGRRPKGWEWAKFTDTAMVLSGGTPKTTEPSYWNGQIPFYTPKDSPDGFYVTSTEKTITEEGLKKCNSRLYPKDTVFITARGTVGNLALASESMAMNQSCYALDSRAELGQHFLFLLTEQLVSGLKKQATGAVFDAITVATFEKTLVIRPTRELLDDFAARVKPLFDASLSLTRRNANLRRTRDLLLPRLVSGELDVSELEIAGVGEEAVA